MDSSAFYQLVTSLIEQFVLVRPLVTFEVTAALFILLIVFILHRQIRALRARLIKLNARVDAL
jgi:hypothetical protein